MFWNKKKMTKEEKNAIKESILTSQIEDFKSYKEIIEPIYLCFFELVKNVFIFSLVINGTALITVINLNNPILNKPIPFIFYNLYLMLIFFIFILYYNFKLLRFLKHKKLLFYHR